MDPHDLYGLPLERFVPERGALAKALRADGQREEAARVAKLRRPSVAAWAVNQLVRTQARQVKALFDAGDALQHAQSELLAGRGDATAMREAGERERASVQELTAVARGLLSSEGHELSQLTLGRVSETLHAAAFDEDARARVREGCLEKELRHVGLGGFGALTGPLPKPGRKQTPSEKQKPEREKPKPPAKADAAQAQKAKQQHQAARKALAEARRLAERAARELTSLQKRRDQAAAALRDAEDELASASERAQQATLAHEQAQQALERL
jgi:hypothetical protein